MPDFPPIIVRQHSDTRITEYTTSDYGTIRWYDGVFDDGGDIVGVVPEHAIAIYDSGSGSYRIGRYDTVLAAAEALGFWDHLVQQGKISHTRRT